jgi:hypothetical protein
MVDANVLQLGVGLAPGDLSASTLRTAFAIATTINNVINIGTVSVRW